MPMDIPNAVTSTWLDTVAAPIEIEVGLRMPLRGVRRLLLRRSSRDLSAKMVPRVLIGRRSRSLSHAREAAMTRPDPA